MVETRALVEGMLETGVVNQMVHESWCKNRRVAVTLQLLQGQRLTVNVEEEFLCRYFSRFRSPFFLHRHA